MLRKEASTFSSPALVMNDYCIILDTSSSDSSLICFASGTILLGIYFCSNLGLEGLRVISLNWEIFCARSWSNC